MKITLTLAEITTLVCNRFQLPPDTEVEIKRPVPRSKNKEIAQRIIDGMIDSFTRQSLLYFGQIPPENKIAAIKALRTVVPGLGIADAKKAVEDWERFIAYVLTNGLPPTANFRW